MSKVGRHQTIEIGGEEERTTIRLKRWSASKLFFLAREFRSLLDKALIGIDLKQLDELKLIGNIIQAFIESEKHAAKLVTLSVDDPADLKEEAVLEWDAADFLVVITEIIEMNLSEELVKNFQRLLASFALKKAEETEPEKKETEPATESQKESAA